MRYSALLLIGGLAWAQSPAARQLYDQHCAACHGSDARGTARAPELVRARKLRGRSTALVDALLAGGRWKQAFTDGRAVVLTRP